MDIEQLFKSTVNWSNIALLVAMFMWFYKRLTMEIDDKEFYTKLIHCSLFLIVCDVIVEKPVAFMIDGCMGVYWFFKYRNIK